MARKMFSVVAFVVVFLGFRAYNFYSDKSDVRAQLEAICEEDGKCKETVAAHFDDCWSQNSSLTGRRATMKVNGSGVVQCLNTAAGAPYFEYEETK